MVCLCMSWHVLACLSMFWHDLIDAMQDVERTKKIPSNASETKGRKFRISVWFE